MKSDTFAYSLVVSSILGLITDFPMWTKVCILLSIISYCLVSVYEKLKK